MDIWRGILVKFGFAFVGGYSFLMFILLLVYALIRRDGNKYNLEHKNLESDMKKGRSYQSIHYNDTSGIYSFGVITSYDELGPGEFLSEKNQDIYTLISPFGSDEYHCVGNCICESDDNNERRSSIILSRGLVYLVAAASSLVAVERSKESFEEECASQYENNDACPKFALKADVEECKSLTISQKVELITKEDQIVFDYMCSGHCVLEGDFQELYMMGGEEEFGDASELRFDDDSIFESDNSWGERRQAFDEEYGELGGFDIGDLIDNTCDTTTENEKCFIEDKSKMCEKNHLESEIVVFGGDLEPDISAKYKFITHHLKPFCSKISVITDDDYDLLEEFLGLDYENDYETYTRMSWCDGGGVVMEGNDIRNVECRRLPFND